MVIQVRSWRPVKQCNIEISFLLVWFSPLHALPMAAVNSDSRFRRIASGPKSRGAISHLSKDQELTVCAMANRAK
jgi:hypothetical protein